MNITEFLEARIAEDEAYASQAQGRHYGWVDNWRAETMHGIKTESVIYAHAFRFSPERMLHECAAKRAIIAQAGIASQDRDTIIVDYYWKTADIAEGYAKDPGKLILQALAAVYSDHPDYRQEWA